MTTPTSDPPWLLLPAEISDRLRPLIDEVVAEIISTIPRDVPDYAMPMEGRFGDGVRRGVSVALNRFLDLPGTRLPALSPDSVWVYESLGRGEVRQGRSLSSLLAAYRSGARVTFRLIARIAPLGDFAPTVLVSLGESLFAYIDELSAVSAQGYALEQSERAGETQRLQTELVETILRGGATEGTLERLAAGVGWAVPDAVHVVTVAHPHTEGLRSSLGSRALVGERGDDRVVVIPAVRSRSARATVERLLGEREAVVGPAVPVARAGDSLAMAVAIGARAEDLRRGTNVVWAGDHLASVVVAAEPLAIDEIARRRLAPLNGLRPVVRERLAETLLAWLRHHGSRARIAEELFVHPQTVGYRVGQLKGLFGDALDDPEVRFELELVLRAGRR